MLVIRPHCFLIVVPHGSVLGPILFSTYVNDVPLVYPEVKTCMYADDTVIHAHGKDMKEAADKLTSVMAEISDWLSEFCLTPNVNETT